MNAVTSFIDRFHPVQLNTTSTPTPPPPPFTLFILLSVTVRSLICVEAGVEGEEEREWREMRKGSGERKHHMDRNCAESRVCRSSKIRTWTRLILSHRFRLIFEAEGNRNLGWTKEMRIWLLSSWIPDKINLMFSLNYESTVPSLEYSKRKWKKNKKTKNQTEKKKFLWLSMRM